MSIVFASLEHLKLSICIKIPFTIPQIVCMCMAAISQYFGLMNYINSNKKYTSDFHGTVSFDPIKMSQPKIYQNVYQMCDTQKLLII